MSIFNDIDKLIEYVNLELQKNPKATVNKLCDKLGIKQSTFKSRVHRANYQFDFKNRRYKKKEIEQVDKELKQEDDKKVSESTRVKSVVEEIVKQKNNKSINKPVEVKSEPEKSFIQQYNKSIDMRSLEELISLIEPIKEVIEEYKKNKDIIDIKPVELKPKSITNVKQKLFKVDVDVLDRWEKFVSEHKQYKVQNLVSMALEEFIEKYK